MTPQSSSAGMFGIGMAGSALTGYGQYEAGQQQRQAYDMNAANQEEAIIQKTASRVGAQGSAYASSGVDIQSGSPLLIMAATAARGAGQARQEGDMLRYEGNMAAWSGTMSGIGSFMSGMTKSLSAYYGATAKSPAPSLSPSSSDTGNMGSWSEFD